MTQSYPWSPWTCGHPVFTFLCVVGRKLGTTHSFWNPLLQIVPAMNHPVKRPPHEVWKSGITLAGELGVGKVAGTRLAVSSGQALRSHTCHSSGSWSDRSCSMQTFDICNGFLVACYRILIVEFSQVFMTPLFHSYLRLKPFLLEVFCLMEPWWSMTIKLTLPPESQPLACGKSHALKGEKVTHGVHVWPYCEMTIAWGKKSFIWRCLQC